jgi:hypothetical protein
MPTKNDPQSEPHVQDAKNDPPPTKGTEQPWERPGQSSQNPGQKLTKPDLDKWKKAIDRRRN